MNDHQIHIIKKGLAGLLLPFILIFLIIACTARIDIATEDAPERLVIYGYVTNISKQQEIRLTRSSGYFVNTPPEGIKNATVTLSTKDWDIILEESENDSGYYRTPLEFSGEEGETYTLRVSVDFDGDGIQEVFEASSYMPYAAPLDSIHYKESTVFDDVIEILLYGEVPPNEENYFSFHLAINDVMLNDSLSEFFIISDEYLVKDKFDGLSCFYLDQEEEESHLASGDQITLYIHVLTKEYADFLENAANEVGGSIPIFSGPPANVETNIRSIENPNNVPVSGFFSAYAESEAKKTYE